MGMTERTSIARARQAIEKLMASGHPTIERSARTLRISPRTLQRRLEQAGVTYGILVEEIRYRLARRRLRDRRVRIADVAAELGYRDASSFSRAFMRWSGMSPRAYRRTVLERGCSNRSIPRSS